MDWADVARFAGRAVEHQQDKEKAKIWDYITLVHIIHSNKPGELVESFKEILEPKPKEVCDIKRLASLKSRRLSARQGY